MYVCFFFLHMAMGILSITKLSFPLSFLKPLHILPKAQKVFFGNELRDGGRWMSLAVTND